MAVVACSRLLLLPAAPWEQDEALFAAAAYDTDLAQHRPHPPGFPLWVAAAKAGRRVCGDPLLALEILSSLASVATVLLLALLWRSALGETAALTGAALFAALPGVWFHAPRAFTSTPATALAAGAALVWERPGAAGLVGGAFLAALALLVRPVLAPPLALLGLLALWLRREPAAGWVRAAAVSALTLLVGFAPLVADSGGLPRFVGLCRDHLAGHAGALHLAPWRLGGLGLVRACGGTIPFAALVVLAGMGMAAARLTGRSRAAWVVLVLATAGWILLAHNRTYPRYTVPALALLVPPAALGVRRLLGARGGAVAGAAAVAAAAVYGWPAVLAQATGSFPPLAALEAAAARGAATVAVEPGVSPFGDLLNLSRQGPRRTVSRPLVASGRVPVLRLAPPLAAVWAQPEPRRWIQPPLHPPLRFDAGSRRLEWLSQHRYLEAWLGLGGAVVLDPAGAGAGPEGAAVSPTLDLLVAPPGHGGYLGLEVVAGKAARVSLSWDGRPLGRKVFPAGRHHVALRPPPVRGGHLVVARIQAAPAVVVRRVWTEDGLAGLGSLEIPPDALAGGLDGLVWSRGLHGLERFPGGRTGRWTQGRAEIFLPLAPGEVEVELSAPRPEPAAVTLAAPPGPPVRVTVAEGWTRVTVPVPERHRRELVLTVENPFVPARETPSSADTRELGVVVGTVRVLTSRRP